MPQPSVTLVRSGRVRFALARLPWQTAEDILEPADELRHHLERCIGATVPTAQHLPAGPAVMPVTLALRWDPELPLGLETFEMEATADRVELRGRTVQAVSHAVYWFLETFLGVRWLWPGSQGEVLPRCRRLVVPLGRQRHEPDFRWRYIGQGGAVQESMDVPTAENTKLRLPRSYQQAMAVWLRRNRFGGDRIAEGHRWAQIAPPEVYGSKHPDWYALVDSRRDCLPHDGKHGNQPCVTHPGVAKRMIDWACARFEAQPELHALSVALNDSDNPCQCRRCLALDRRCGSDRVAYADDLARQTTETGEVPVKHRSITDRVFWLSNRVAAAVAKRFPDRQLLIHLYGHYRMPPVTQKLDPRVIGQYCVMSHSFWAPKVEAAEISHLRTMGASVPSLGIYDYYANGQWPEAHRLYPQLVESSVRAYHRCGVRYFGTQPPGGFAINGLNLFVLGRCLWNVGTRSGDVMDDYCRAGFGKASRVVRRYLQAFAQRWRQTVGGTTLPRPPVPMLLQAELYPPAFLKARAAELRQARRLLRGDGEALARVAFLAKGLEFTTRLATAAAKTWALCRTTTLDEQAVPTLPTDPRAARRTIRAARVAAKAWDHHWDFVRRHAGQFVFGDFWVHYRPGLFGARDRMQRRVHDLARADL